MNAAPTPAMERAQISVRGEGVGMSATAQAESAAYSVALTLFTGKAATDKAERICTLYELKQMVLTTDAPAKEELPWLKFAQFGERRTDRGSLRHDKNVLAVTGVEADYD